MRLAVIVTNPTRATHAIRAVRAVIRRIMRPKLTLCVLALLAVFASTCWSDNSSDSWGTGRLSLFTQGSQFANPDGSTSSFNELVTYFSLHSPYSRETGLEFGIDLRTAAYPGTEGRSTRFSLYNAYVGHSSSSFGFRAGQIWINELGSLGSVGGGQFYYKKNHFHAGGFGGLEPEILSAGYVTGVRKYGGYIAFDGDKGRNNAIGYVMIRNQGVSERSVLVFTNYIPAANRLFVYQSAELDLSGPAGQGNGGLNYFFINARGNVSPSVELQGSYHHGHSIDSRSITLDQINGRPVSPESLKGFLFESADTRVTVTVFSNFRLFGGFGRDKGGPDQAAVNRFQYGFYTTNILKSGFDVQFSGYRYTPQTGLPYGSWSVSAGHMLGTKVYLSGIYSSSLAILTATDQGGVQVQNQPHSSRYSLSSTVNLSRAFSLQFDVDRTTGDLQDETRFLAGINYRFY